MKKTATKSTGTRGAGRPAGSTSSRGNSASISRILVGVRIEPRLVKVMKAMAELHECALGELIERVFWSAMEGQNALADKGGKLSADVKQQVQSLKQVYGVNYDLEVLTRPRERATSAKKKV